MDKDELFDDIARLAYELFEKRGGTAGQDLDDWFMAEQIISKCYPGTKALVVQATAAVHTEKVKKSRAASKKNGLKEGETKEKVSGLQKKKRVMTVTRNLSSFAEIIVFAIEKEKEAKVSYEQMSKDEPYSGTKEVFREFAREEKKHQVLLEEYQKGIAQIADYRYEVIPDLKISDYLADVAYKKGMDYTEALRLAMKREERSVRLYSDLAVKTGKEDLRRIFQMLSQEEAKHKLGLEILYDTYLAKTGG